MRKLLLFWLLTKFGLNLLKCCWHLDLIQTKEKIPKPHVFINYKNLLSQKLYGLKISRNFLVYIYYLAITILCNATKVIEVSTACLIHLKKKKKSKKVL